MMIIFANAIWLAIQQEWRLRQNGSNQQDQIYPDMFRKSKSQSCVCGCDVAHSSSLNVLSKMLGVEATILPCCSRISRTMF